MIPEFGHALVKSKHGDFVFRPTLGRLSALCGGDHSIPVSYFVNLKSAQHQMGIHLFSRDGVVCVSALKSQAEVIAERVLCAFCDTSPKKLFSEPWMYLKKYANTGILYGRMGALEKIALAGGLMMHAIIGSKIDELAKSGAGNFSNEFDPAKHISAAVAHLDLTPEQAADSTMTQIQYLMLARGVNKDSGAPMSKEQYEEGLARIKQKMKERGNL